MKNLKLIWVAAMLAAFVLVWGPATAQEPVKPDPPDKQEKPDTPDNKGPEEPDKPEKEEPVEESKEGPPSQIYLKDGMYVVGELNLEVFEIETAYGKLVVPKEQVVKIRIGKAADQELKKKIETLIEQIGDEEYNVREAAKKALQELGRVALQELREALKSEDIEVKTTAEEIVREIEAQSPPDAQEYIDDDEVETVKFTIRGTVLMEELNIFTRYGTLKFKKKDIRSITIGRPSGVQQILTVTGASNSGPSSMLDTGINIRKGDKVTITASGTVYIRHWGLSVSPDGNQSSGTQISGIPAGALMGKVGNNGPLFLVGSSHKSTADRAGRLFLGIAVRDRYSNEGNFKVKVAIERK